MLYWWYALFYYFEPRLRAFDCILIRYGHGRYIYIDDALSKLWVLWVFESRDLFLTLNSSDFLRRRIYFLQSQLVWLYCSLRFFFKLQWCFLNTNFFFMLEYFLKLLFFNSCLQHPDVLLQLRFTVAWYFNRINIGCPRRFGILWLLSNLLDAGRSRQTGLRSLLFHIDERSFIPSRCLITRKHLNYLNFNFLLFTSLTNKI